MRKVLPAGINAADLDWLQWGRNLTVAEGAMDGFAPAGTRAGFNGAAT